jgi:hypothetical protein
LRLGLDHHLIAVGIRVAKGLDVRSFIGNVGS